MQVTESEGDLCTEESNVLLRETLDLHEMAEKLTSLNELHEEVDAMLVLEDVLHIYKEGVVNGVEDIFLKSDVLQLVVL